MPTETATDIPVETQENALGTPPITKPAEPDGRTGVRWHSPLRAPREIPEPFLTPTDNPDKNNPLQGDVVKTIVATPDIIDEPTDALGEELQPQPERALMHNRRGLSRLRDLSWRDKLGLAVTATALTGGGAGSAAILLRSNTGAEANPSAITHVIERQTAYQDSEPVTITDIQNKYDVQILSEQDAYNKMGLSKKADTDTSIWTKTKLLQLDQNLANVPPALIGEIENQKLAFFTGSPDNVPQGDCQAGACTDFFDIGSNGERIIYLAPGFFEESAQQSLPDLVHELGHNKDAQTKGKLENEAQNLIGDKSYLDLPEFSNLPTDPYVNLTIQSLEGLAGANSKDQHINKTEGFAELAQQYTQGYPAFLNAYGKELDGVNGKKGNADNPFPISDSLLEQTFPKADALYKFLQNKIFDGYGYDSQGNMVNGKDAIPDQFLQTPASTTASPGAAVIDGQTVRLVGGPTTYREYSASINPPTGKAA